MGSSIVTYDYVKNLGTGKNELLIDVREPTELQETGTIPHSINIPLGTLEEAFQKLPQEQFEAKFGKKKPEKEDPIIVSCKMGGRSAKAKVLLEGIGYKNIKNYSGGWLDWEKHTNQ